MLPIIISSFNRGHHVRSVLVKHLDTIAESAVCNGSNAPDECGRTNKTPKTVCLTYRFETEHYVLFLLIDTLNWSRVFCAAFVQQFAHLECDQLQIKYNLIDTPLYPLPKSW